MTEPHRGQAHDAARHPSNGTAIGNPALTAWVRGIAARTRPDRIVWCDGSDDERRALTAEAVASGALIELDATALPGCHYHRSDPADVARVEHRTFICTTDERDAGPTNNWMSPDEAYAKLGKLLDGAMTGRTMYVVPYLMGPEGSPFSKVGIELTDSVYVVLNMGIMTRMGAPALAHLGSSDEFNRGVHATLDLDPEKRFICHFPQDDTVWSVGSGYGGNALLGKKCFALRIASWKARREGWMAEHMMLLEVEDPEGRKRYVAGAFPSACGKTNFAMMVPPPAYAGWKVRTIGDDIAWLRVGADGRLWAVNPENGYFGVVPGTSMATNPNAMAAIGRDTIYTNVALAPDGTVWWEGKDGPPPEGLLDWKGRPWSPGSGEPAAHRNSRFTAPMRNNPAFSPLADDPAGVPIDVVVFGGRRADTVPLVAEAFDWTHGVYMGATLGSETTAAAVGTQGVVRRDPMAMRPFCGYHMGDYFEHWLEIGFRLSRPPKVFTVNWFRKDGDGKFLWPGFGENMRILEWMLKRADNEVGARYSPAGWLPGDGDVRLHGLTVADGALREAFRVDEREQLRELVRIDEHFRTFGDRLPTELVRQRDLAFERFRSDAP